MMKAVRKPALEQRINDLRAEIKSVVEARVEAIAKESPGVPPGVIRNLLIARAPGCPCTQYFDLVGTDALQKPGERSA